MQQIYPARLLKFVRVGLAPLLMGIVAGLGCRERPTTIDPPPPRPYAGVTLTVAAADPADRDLVRNLARSWAVRTGAEVRVSDAPFDGTADVGVIPPADLGKWAEAGRLAEVPAERKSPADAYRWDDLLRPWAERLTTWGYRTYALPITGEGMVLVYRKDAFDGKDGRPAAPPATWDELAALAPKTGLPPLPAAADRLLAEFFLAAASYDRPAVGRLAAADLLRQRETFFAFQFDPRTGDPRLTARAFIYVADLFQKMQPHRSRQPDAAAAFRTGEAKLGVLTLAELGRIGPDAAEGLGVAPLPGARVTFDPLTGQDRPTDRELVNRVPYHGWGGRVGVVSASSTDAAAAWDFLTDCGLPERTALDLLADPRWGAGPYRSSQLEARARSRWYGYGLSAPETERLTTALGDNLGLGVENYRIRLRTPDHADLDAALDAHLRALVTGKDTKPADAMARANAAWKALIDRKGPDAWRAVANRSLGF